jgi:ribosomal protein S18 acetylase RimI-like enzyme
MLKNIKFKFERVYNSINRKGFKNLIIIIINFIFTQFIAIGYIYKIELSNFIYAQENKNFEFKLINEQDLDIIQKNYEKEFTMNSYRDFSSKLKKPNVDCFIIKNRNEICGYFFLAYGKAESELEKKYLNIEKNGYLFNDYVFEKHRNKKIHQYSIYKRLSILKEKKYETATCMIQYDNTSSIKSYEKLGFHRYLMKYFFRFRNLIRSKEYYKII